MKQSEKSLEEKIQNQATTSIQVKRGWQTSEKNVNPILISGTQEKWTISMVAKRENIIIEYLAKDMAKGKNSAIAFLFQ